MNIFVKVRIRGKVVELDSSIPAFDYWTGVENEYETVEMKVLESTGNEYIEELKVTRRCTKERQGYEAEKVVELFNNTTREGEPTRSFMEIIEPKEIEVECEPIKEIAPKYICTKIDRYVNQYNMYYKDSKPEIMKELYEAHGINDKSDGCGLNGILIDDEYYGCGFGEHGALVSDLIMSFGLELVKEGVYFSDTVEPWVVIPPSGFNNNHIRFLNINESKLSTEQRKLIQERSVGHEC